MRDVLIQFESVDTPQGKMWRLVKYVATPSPNGEMLIQSQNLAEGVTPLPKPANDRRK
jgi:hypothetical protein